MTSLLILGAGQEILAWEGSDADQRPLRKIRRIELSIDNRMTTVIDSSGEDQSEPDRTPIRRRRLARHGTNTDSSATSSASSSAASTAPSTPLDAQDADQKRRLQRLLDMEGSKAFTTDGGSGSQHSNSRQCGYLTTVIGHDDLGPWDDIISDSVTDLKASLRRKGFACNKLRLGSPVFRGECCLVGSHSEGEGSHFLLLLDGSLRSMAEDPLLGCLKFEQPISMVHWIDSNRCIAVTADGKVHRVLVNSGNEDLHQDSILTMDDSFPVCSVPVDSIFNKYPETDFLAFAGNGQHGSIGLTGVVAENNPPEVNYGLTSLGRAYFANRKGVSRVTRDSYHFLYEHPEEQGCSTSSISFPIPRERLLQSLWGEDVARYLPMERSIAVKSHCYINENMVLFGYSDGWVLSANIQNPQVEAQIFRDADALNLASLSYSSRHRILLLGGSPGASVYRIHPQHGLARKVCSLGGFGKTVHTVAHKTPPHSMGRAILSEEKPSHADAFLGVRELKDKQSIDVYYHPALNEQAGNVIVTCSSEGYFHRTVIE